MDTTFPTLKDPITVEHDATLLREQKGECSMLHQGNQSSLSATVLPGSRRRVFRVHGPDLAIMKLALLRSLHGIDATMAVQTAGPRSTFPTVAEFFRCGEQCSTSI